MNLDDLNPLERSLGILEATLNSTADGILVVDKNRRILRFNERFVRMFDITTELLEGDDLGLAEFISKKLENSEQASVRMDEIYAKADEEGRDRLRMRDGRILDRYSVPMRIGGAIVGRVWNYRDATDPVRMEERLLYDAFHDSLTGLYNRSMFINRLEHALAHARRNSGYRFAVLFIDLNGFKEVNDRLGHAAGDRILVEVGRRLLGVVRSEDTVARLGGDEFTVLLEDARGEDDAHIAADRILRSFADPLFWNGHELGISAAIGMAFYGPEYRTPGDILRDADAAMYKAKHENRSIHSATTAARQNEEADMEAALRNAIRDEKISVVYQPVISVPSRVMSGVEALIRWMDVHQVIFEPTGFLAAAERSDLIVPLGQWTVDNVLLQMRYWQDNGMPPLSASVNVSARQLMYEGFADEVLASIRRANMDAGLFSLELKEWAFPENSPIRRALEILHAEGVGIILDDFGAAGLSVEALRGFPARGAKLDRALIAAVPRDAHACTMVKALLSTAKGLGFIVTAKGVETAEQADYLAGLGFDHLQGFYFSRPVGPDDIRDFQNRNA